MTEPDLREVHASHPHDSARAHVAGIARYIDDLPEPPGLLHLAFGLAPDGHADLEEIDLSAVRSAPGVFAVFTAADIPGENNVGPVRQDEPLLAVDTILFPGQPLFLVAADSTGAARRAARKAVVRSRPRNALVSISDARAAESLIEDNQLMARGDVANALSKAPHRLQGRIEIGGQEHFYLEGQVALAMPDIGDGLHILSSTQHPSEVQQLISRLLARNHADIVVEVRRMGGAFGGKETQAVSPAAACALVAALTGRPAKMRLDRDDDMAITGKRHDFIAEYDVGFDANGQLHALKLSLSSRCGATTDLSPGINDRAMSHADNAYFLPAVEIVSHRLKTHTVSNTAFRGFGAPQGMMAIERVMDAVAHSVGRDPLAVRSVNLYGPGRDVTPYGMQIADNIAPALIAALARHARYDERVAAVAEFNARHAVLKKGLALTPVKFGISFIVTHLNQAGALMQVYTDGSIQLNHGGTEMGQGLMIKVAQIVADVFGVPVETVRITATRTDKVPNTSATAASAGADLNGMAAWNAAEAIRTRLAELAAARSGGTAADVRFTRDGVVTNDQCIPFATLTRMAHLNRISLSATGFYATPGIHYDRAKHMGRPYRYFTYGAALSEVVIDTLTGEHRVVAVDILQDVGRSLNPAIDLGQIEGGFIQGMGWLTTEELVYDDRGRLLTHAPSTYKIPTANDRPRRMNIRLWQGEGNADSAIHRSKAVGEPPLMLAISVFSALTQAIAAAAPGKGLPDLDAPATPERILSAIERLRAR
jgi:xanthine dehydrogenase large subunit